MKKLNNIFGSFGKKDLSMAGSGNTEPMLQNKDDAHQETKYQCPMKCEGDKIYDEPGNCPECNMKLMPIDDKNSGGHHSHHGCC